MPRMLVVDDSPVMLHLIARIVKSSEMGFDCVFAASGKEALTVLRSAPVDVMLTDIHMPEMDGEQLVGIMRLDKALRDIPVIVVSSDATRPRVDRLVAAGVRGYLCKPFTLDAFRKELNRVLGEKRV